MKGEVKQSGGDRGLVGGRKEKGEQYLWGMESIYSTFNLHLYENGLL